MTIFTFGNSHNSHDSLPLMLFVFLSGGDIDHYVQDSLSVYSRYCHQFKFQRGKGELFLTNSSKLEFHHTIGSEQ